MLLAKMARAEKVSAHKFNECKIMLEKDRMEPMKSMQKKYAEAGVLDQ